MNMGRKREFRITPGRIEHIPSGKVAFLQERDKKSGAIRGYFTEDLFMGTAITEVKKFFKQLYGGKK
jgi:hypothetical protein